MKKIFGSLVIAIVLSILFSTAAYAWKPEGLSSGSDRPAVVFEEITEWIPVFTSDGGDVRGYRVVTYLKKVEPEERVVKTTSHPGEVVILTSDGDVLGYRDVAYSPPEREPEEILVRTLRPGEFAVFNSDGDVIGYRFSEISEMVRVEEDILPFWGFWGDENYYRLSFSPWKTSYSDYGVGVDFYFLPNGEEVYASAKFQLGSAIKKGEPADEVVRLSLGVDLVEVREEGETRFFIRPEKDKTFTILGAAESGIEGIVVYNVMPNDDNSNILVSGRGDPYILDGVTFCWN